MSTNTVCEDFKVKDMSLADWGRKEIILAENEMPGLMALRKKIWINQTFKRCTDCWLLTYDHSNGSTNGNSG